MTVTGRSFLPGSATSSTGRKEQIPSEKVEGAPSGRVGVDLAGYFPASVDHGAVVTTAKFFPDLSKGEVGFFTSECHGDVSGFD